MHTILAPIEGTVMPLEQTVDPIFSQKMLGDGLAITPDAKAKTIYAPVSGKISVINEQKHAVVILSSDGLEVLVHVGVDTFDLNGKGFAMQCSVGQKVEAGQVLIEVDIPYIKEHATAETVFVIITNTDKKMHFFPTSLKSVGPSDVLFNIR